jgi:predicted methyltransferase
MHRVKGIDPMEDARMKARLCARPGIDMLEIGTGLGYSTIACLEIGVRSILTIERNPEVSDLARVNTWSQRLFVDERVTMVSGDASEKIVGLEGERFDAVLHDPPRFSIAAELYTTNFYTEILRVMKTGGILYHYVGSPGSKHGRKDLQRGVIRRLRDAGFSDVVRNEASLGVVARKA